MYPAYKGPVDPRQRQTASYQKSQSVVSGSAKLTSIVPKLLSTLMNVEDIIDKMHRQALANSTDENVRKSK